MKKTIINLFIITLAIMSCANIASAENMTEEISIANIDEESVSETNVEEKERKMDEEVKALENGHLNTTFDNGYNGYCIDYCDEEAEINDTFVVKDTSHALNNNTNESVGNYLKAFFVDYNDIAMKDPIVTQHIIWHFTDDFNGWRVDPDLIESIKLTASNKTIPDNGARIKIDNLTEAIFDFMVLSSEEKSHQNYFAYRITYQNITENNNDNDTANITNLTSDSRQNMTEDNNGNATQNITNLTNNTQSNESAITQNNMSNNNTDNTDENATSANDVSYNQTTKDENNMEKSLKSIKKHNSNSVAKHSTGNPLNILVVGLLMLVEGILIRRHRRD